ncbi:MAG: SprT-like domain-containing protein [Elusimicrobiota bacterium]
MELEKARLLAADLMRRHDLGGGSPWAFAFDRSRRRFGVCIPQHRRIQLSRHLTLLNGEEQVRDTLLHEIAHALVFLRYGPRIGHDRRWKKIAAAIGAKPARCYDYAAVDTPPLPYLVKCERHGILGQRARRWSGQRSCSRCRRRFDPEHLVALIPNPAYRDA